MKNLDGQLGKSDWLAAGGILLIALISRLVFIQFTVDDAYITLRYAENLAMGNGFVFNIGERVYGTTTPLFTIFLAGLRQVTDNPLIWGKVLNVLCDSVVALITLLLGRYFSGRAWVGYLVGLLYALNPVSVKWSALGMETGLYTFLVCLSLWQHTRRHHRTAYAFAGMAALTRIDGALVFGVLVAADILRHRRGWVIDVLIGARR